MTKSIEMTGPNPAPTRRVALGLLGASVLGAGLVSGSARAENDEKVLTEALVLRDPEIPVIGNANGDITIVEYYDYNCPYCRKIAPEIRQVVQDDGKVRLVLKDWPILGEVSKIAARMALAAKYQDKFVEAHDALIGVSSRLTEPRIREAMDGDKTIRVNLATPIPVLIFYGTAAVMEDGEVRFFQDIYGHDEELAAVLKVARMPSRQSGINPVSIRSGSGSPSP